MIIYIYIYDRPNLLLRDASKGIEHAVPCKTQAVSTKFVIKVVNNAETSQDKRAPDHHNGTQQETPKKLKGNPKQKAAGAQKGSQDQKCSLGSAHIQQEYAKTGGTKIGHQKPSRHLTES